MQLGYGLILFLIGAGAFLAAGALWAYMAALEFREARAIICPETLRPAEVKVDGAYAARTRLAGHEELRVTACSRWPEQQGCDQACTPQVPLVGDSRQFRQFAAFGLTPRLLRINNPVSMTPSLYDALSAEFARQASRRRVA